MGDTEKQGVRNSADGEPLTKIYERWHEQVYRGSVEKSMQLRWERFWRQLALAALKENSARELSDETMASFERNLISEVRGPDCTITDLFREITCLKRVLTEVPPALDHPDAHRLAAARGNVSAFLDRLFGRCLTKTSLIHELVIEGSARGYCQVDAEGQIISANASMNRLLSVADSKGLFLPRFFGKQEAFVAEALFGQGGGAPVLRRMELVTSDGRKVPVTAEFGSIAIDPTISGGYAIVVDVSSLIQAEYRAYEASKLGILKYDLNLCITYANRTARRIFGDEAADLVGISTRDLFPEPEAQAKIQDEFARRQKGEGSTYELPYHRAADGKIIPLRINAMPEYDNLGDMIGVFVVVEDILIEKVGQKIQNLVQEYNKGHHLFKAMFEQLKSLIDFDFGSIAIYSRDMTVARTIHFHPRPEPLWPTLWFPISPDLKRWIEGQSEVPLWQPTIQAFLADQGGTEEIAGDPTVKRLIEEGYKAFICYPIWEGGQVVAVVCLMSYRHDFFNAEHYKILGSLPIDRIVRTGLSYRDRAEHSFLHRLNKQITEQHHTAHVAKVIVKRLARFFHWQNVSIFKVNRIRGVFKLLAQAEGPLDGFLLPKGYEQVLTKGILGQALKRGAAINVPNTERKDGDAAHYIASNERARSDLCLPIQILCEPVWLLNLEDSRLNAFSHQDICTLERIIEDIETTLETTFKSMIFDEIFEVASDGVIVADTEGRMLQINPQARAILKIPQVGTGEHNLSDFVPDDEIRRFLIAGKQIAPTRVVFATASGDTIPMLVSGSVLPEEYGRRVIFLKEIEALEWRRDARAVADALGEIVAQTRTPLSMASTLLRRAGRAIVEDSARDLIERARQQLSRAEVTYDRVSLSGDTGLPSTNTPLSLVRLTNQAMEDLGVKSYDEVELVVDQDLPSIRGNAFELTFVVKSILGYLLRAKPLVEKVEIRSGTDGDAIWMVISAKTGQAESDKPLDGWEEAAERARAQVALGEPTIERFIVEHHHGTYQRSIGDDGQEVFSLHIGGVG